MAIDRRKFIEELYDGEPLMFADGFDDAIIGVSDPCPSRSATVTYDYDKCIEILKSGGMDPEDVEEHMAVNVVGAWVGENTPTFVHTFD